MILSRRSMLANTGAALIAAAGPALAQQRFPAKAVTLIVPFAPGGITDGAARAIAQGLSEQWKQPVLVDNRPGGGTVAGTRDVARAAPDGYTLLLTSFGYVMNQVLMKNLPYDPQSLTALNMVGLAPNVLYLNPALKLDTVAEVVAYAKTQPGGLTFASSGNASSPHIAAELFNSITRTNNVHVPYRGTGPAMADVLGGQVSGIFDTMQSLPYAKAGKLRAIATTSKQRLHGAPDLPTFAEAGYPDMDIASWFGFFAPAGTPAAVQRQVVDAIDKVLANADARRKLELLGLESPSDNSPAAFRAFLDNERRRWAALAKERDIHMD
jgi:tripartite-type tricarboxylate transporter receptor subunit TctC